MPAVQLDLSDIKRALMARRGELSRRRERVEHDLERRNEPLHADSSDQAIQLQNDETLEAIGAAARAEISGIDAALVRLSTGRYGVCEKCGGQIAEARLRVIPYAVRCADCADL